MSVLPSLVIPLAIGAMAYMGLSAAIQTGWIDNEETLRYLTGHPISKLTTAMFFVGGASLLIIAWNISQQFRWEKSIRLPFEGEPGTATELDQAVVENETSEQLQETTEHAEANAADFRHDYLNSLPERIQEHYLWKRLYTAIEYVGRTGSATNVEEELKYLSDNDHNAQQPRYSLVRIMIWAMPMLGFLGTVLGISQALGGLNMGADSDLQQVMGGLQASLYVAFDTTAVALTLSIVLMFCTFIVERFEMQLLDQVDLRARKEIADQFDFTGKPDSAVQTMERIGRAVLAATHETVQKQAELWMSTIEKAEQAWLMTSSDTHEVLRQNLSVVIDGAIIDMGELLSQAIYKADESLATRWEQWQITMSDNARQIVAQQDSLKQHSELLQTLLQQIGNLEQYQTAVNSNLDALASTSRLDTTLASLNNVIFELNRKLGKQIAEPITGQIKKPTSSAKDKSFSLRIAEGTKRAA